MSILEMGALGEFIGSIAVIVTVLFLGFQMRQNTGMMRAQLRPRRPRPTDDHLALLLHVARIVRHSGT